MDILKTVLFGVATLGALGSLDAQEMTKPELIKADGKGIDIKHAYAAPLCVDLDKDGLKDLIVGNFKGEFQFYKNTGTNEIPVFKGSSLIEANGKPAIAKNW